MNRELLILSLQEEYMSRLRCTGSTITGEAFRFLFALLANGWREHKNVEALYRLGWLLLSRHDKNDIDSGWQIVKTAAMIGHPGAALDMFVKDFKPESLDYDLSSLHWLRDAVLLGDSLAAKWYILLADANKLMPERKVMEEAVQALEQEVRNS